MEENDTPEDDDPPVPREELDVVERVEDEPELRTDERSELLVREEELDVRTLEDVEDVDVAEEDPLLTEEELPPRDELDRAEDVEDEAPAQ